MQITIQRDHARTIRKTMTRAERTVWNQLKSRQLSGHRFNRQVEIGPYIVALLWSWMVTATVQQMKSTTTKAAQLTWKAKVSKCFALGTPTSTKIWKVSCQAYCKPWKTKPAETPPPPFRSTPPRLRREGEISPSTKLGEYVRRTGGGVSTNSLSKRRQPKFQCDLESDEGAGIEVEAGGALISVFLQSQFPPSLLPSKSKNSFSSQFESTFEASR
jgi:hypothetical protein